jgi:molecular chaperone DnaK
VIHVGIDLGTTNSAVAFHDGHGAQIIEASSGLATMPSVIALEEGGGILVGAPALKQRILQHDPLMVFANIKRHIGLPFIEGEDYGPQVVRGEDGMRWFKGPDRLWSPEELSAEILKVLKARAEKRLGRKVDGAVITVPAGFNNVRIKATKDAGTLAGFKKVTVITEPEAAVRAYNLHRMEFSRTLVFDLGGGTFDVVLAKTGLGVYETLMKGGDDKLGGADFDRQIINHIVETFRAEKGRDLRDRRISMLKLRPEAEGAKKELTDYAKTRIEVMNVSYDEETGMMDDINTELTVDQFNEMTSYYINQAMSITEAVMKAAQRLPKEVDNVLLVGGMTVVPAVRKAVDDYFGPERVRDGVNPHLAVAIGAAVRAAEIDGRVSQKTAVRETTGQSFGIEVEGNQLIQVLPAGTEYGALKSVVVTTAKDGQDVIPICVLQGDHPQANQNALLGRYNHKVMPGDAYSHTITLDMMVDENGLLMVTGKDEDTGESFEVLGST